MASLIVAAGAESNRCKLVKLSNQVWCHSDPGLSIMGISSSCEEPYSAHELNRPTFSFEQILVCGAQASGVRRQILFPKFVRAVSLADGISGSRRVIGENGCVWVDLRCCCSVLQCLAVCCSVLQRVAAWSGVDLKCSPSFLIQSDKRRWLAV